MTPGTSVRRIEPQFLRKIWGSRDTGPWFGPCPPGPTGEEIGEVWFPAGDLLIKFLFTSADLSVQVHPDDAYAKLHENSRGKMEMWHILRAAPGARVALGFTEPVSAAEMLEAAETGWIVELLDWKEVHPGQTYFVPPGTVHAIGAGVAVCEIQQNSDITYRLFDYFRGRELHLNQAKDVAQGTCHPGQAVPRELGDGVQLLVECPYFRTYRVAVERAGEIGKQLGSQYLVVLEGSGRVNEAAAVPGNVFATDADSWQLEPESGEKSGSMQVLLIGSR